MNVNEALEKMMASKNGNELVKVENSRRVVYVLILVIMTCFYVFASTLKFHE